jgi:hypothetical protein
MWYWKLAIIRLVIYGSMVAWGVIKAGTEGYNSFSDMPPQARDKMIGDALFAAGGVVLAFLDSTISRLTQGKQDAEQVAKDAPVK